MFGTSRTGSVYTSVHLHPVKLLMLAVAILMIGLAMISSDTLWAIPGIAVVLLGLWVGYIGVRQIVRALRTFFS